MPYDGFLHDDWEPSPQSGKPFTLRHNNGETTIDLNQIWHFMTRRPERGLLEKGEKNDGYITLINYKQDQRPKEFNCVFGAYIMNENEVRIDTPIYEIARQLCEQGYDVNRYTSICDISQKTEFRQYNL